MALPTDFSAIESADYSYLFYTRPNGAIAFLKSNTTHEDPDTKYSPSNVISAGNTVEASVPRVSAVSYTLHGNREIRLYYIVKKAKGSGHQLAELCQTNGGEWKPGVLNKNNVTCSEKSLISANVENGQGDLKVFFMDPDGQPGVAWVTLGQTTWSQHLLDNSW
ncbi:hypothetical protein F5B20DRAFT_518481 [Whalleya microplaca]|nr:hypothetical protein F5B20DRAFT_518481 [Whalleya microplaca]